MKSIMTYTLALILAITTIAAVSAQSNEPVGPRLPSNVRALLLEEMNAILLASQEILDAMVRGDHETVAINAQAIHDSFILRQKMTDEDRQALRNAVPDSFVQQDQAFHTLTAKLAAAARNGDHSKQKILFDEMLGSCIACHERYAHDRFPNLVDIETRK